MWEIFWGDIYRDLAEIVEKLTYEDFLRLIGLLVWLGLLFFSQKVFDRRDKVAGLSYAAFFSAVGVFVIVVLPDFYVEPLSVKTSFLVTILLGVAAYVRWAWGVEDTNIVKENNEISDQFLGVNRSQHGNQK